MSKWVGVAQIFSVDQMGSVLEGSDKSEGSQDADHEEINNLVLDPFVQAISLDVDGEGLQGNRGRNRRGRR